MIKNKLLIALFSILSLSLITGCGSKNTVDNNNGSSLNESSTIKYQKDNDLPDKVEVNLTTSKYCIDSVGYAKRSATGYILQMNSYFVIYDQYVDLSSKNEYGVNIAKITKSNEVLENMKNQVISVADKGLIRADQYDFVINSKSDVKVNNWEMTKYKGKFLLTTKYTTPLAYSETNFVAYSTMKDGYPVYFMVVNKPDGDSPIDIEKMADKIAKTFRDYDGNCYDD